MRKLASVQRILELRPIEGADRIEMARVLGWALVIKKGEFKVGDLCVYVEIDSKLPEQPEFEFMRDRKFRVKTVKLRGQVSQGIVFPLSILSGYSAIEGEDVTGHLGIVKYEPPKKEHLGGDVKGSFPGFLHKTDEERIQTMPELLSPDYPGRMDLWYVTEKLDGTSATTYLTKEGEFGICSRNLELNTDDDSNAIVRVFKELDIENKLRNLVLSNQGVALQGELIGPGIQKNKYKLAEKEFRLFSVFLIDDFRYALYEEYIRMCNMLNEVKSVPLVDIHYVLPSTIDDLVEFSRGCSLVNHDIPREGIVVRNREDGTSFKVVNPDFLLKFGE